MTDGLEINETRYSELGIDNEKYRFDSEFYLKRFTSAYQKIKTINYTTIRDVMSCLTDFHSNGSYESIAANFVLLDSPDYAYMVRTTDLETDNFSENIKYITKHAYEYLAKSKLFGGELLINKIGSPGRTYLMPHLNKPVSLGMNLFMLRTKKDIGTNEAVLYLFFNSHIGKAVIERKINGTVPLTIDKEAIKSLYVPLFSDKLSDTLNLALEKISLFKRKSLESYNDAKKLLDTYLNIKINSDSTYSVKALSNSLMQSGRLDAEYYQPKYDALFDSLQQFPVANLSGDGGLVSINKSIEPGSEAYQDEGIPFVRVSDVNKYGITEPSIKLSITIVPDIESLYPHKDTILLSKDGSIGIAYKVQEDMQVVTSGALLHLKIKDETKVLPDYLTLVLNSQIVQLQAERDCNGAIIQHWKPSDVEKVLIPILDMDKQKEISDKVQESFRLRKEAQHLLDNAIKAVEMAIETDESTALAWLKTQQIGE